MAAVFKKAVLQEELAGSDFLPDHSSPDYNDFIFLQKDHNLTLLGDFLAERPAKSYRLWNRQGRNKIIIRVLPPYATTVLQAPESVLPAFRADPTGPHRQKYPARLLFHSLFAWNRL